MRKCKRLWTLLYKFDKNERQRVWKYANLRRKEIAGHQKHGWKVIE